MRRRRSWMALCIVATGFAARGLSGPPDVEIIRSTVDGGGAMLSTGGVFELSGTIGQPDAGRMAGSDFELFGGFWFPIVTGDCNADGGINLFDFAGFGACVTGPNGGLAQPECACLDFDKDNDVDLRDFGRFQAAFSTP